MGSNCFSLVPFFPARCTDLSAIPLRKGHKRGRTWKRYLYRVNSCNMEDIQYSLRILIVQYAYQLSTCNQLEAQQVLEADSALKVGHPMGFDMPFKISLCKYIFTYFH